MPIVRGNGLPRLFLIRHGDTEWTDTRRHTGRTDVPLNARGEHRAKTLGDLLRGETFARVFTSPLSRASRTCAIAGFGDRCEIDADLVEWDYGTYEGLTTAEVRKRQPDWNLFRDGTPGGETREEVARRAGRFIQKARGIDGDVAAFSSGHTIRMIAARWLGLSPADAWHFYTATASVGVLGYEHDRDEPVVLLWNLVPTDGGGH